MLPVLVFLAGVSVSYPDVGWRKSETVSPIDDTRTETVQAISKNEYVTSFGKKGHADLVIQCSGRTTLIAITFPDYFMSDLGQHGLVAFRVDKGKAIQKVMRSTTDNKSLGMQGGSAITLAKSLLGGTELVVRVVPVNESPKDAFFDLTGLAKSISNLRDRCGW